MPRRDGNGARSLRIVTCWRKSCSKRWKRGEVKRMRLPNPPPAAAGEGMLLSVCQK